MQTEPPSVEIRFTNEFERRLQSLSRKYRRIGSDIQPLFPVKLENLLLPVGIVAVVAIGKAGRSESNRGE